MLETETFAMLQYFTANFSASYNEGNGIPTVLQSTSEKDTSFAYAQTVKSCFKSEDNSSKPLLKSNSNFWKK